MVLTRSIELFIEPTYASTHASNQDCGDDWACQSFPRSSQEAG
ncbi:hypothetical protein [Rivularia sp. UHCC 0363]|nr:hypothetical protein [Rivularia sp. UHCC 0363]MEA5597349.1 hypothetical protein [Rivularia sp. UHCC 0363]